MHKLKHVVRVSRESKYISGLYVMKILLVYNWDFSAHKFFYPHLLHFTPFPFTCGGLSVNIHLLWEVIFTELGSLAPTFSGWQNGRDT